MTLFDKLNKTKVYYLGKFGYSSHIEINRKNFQNLGQESSDLIKEYLLSDKPCFITRLGYSELYCMMNYLSIDSFKKNNYFTNLFNFFTKRYFFLGWEPLVKKTLINVTGFFPDEPDYLEKFAKLNIRDLDKVDILASWLKMEDLFKKELSNSKKITLEDLNPYTHNDPWSQVLEGKKVLVISPFEESIKNQYHNKRKLLFKNEKVLPDFELLTIKAVQSHGKNTTKFKDWFEALYYMKSEIDKKEFDIAILGCGGYGFPLGAYIKSIGKKSIVMGGTVQLLFGIYGNRWLSDGYQKYPIYKNLFNEHWVRPLEIERPKDINIVEDAAYF